MDGDDTWTLGPASRACVAGNTTNEVTAAEEPEVDDPTCDISEDDGSDDEDEEMKNLWAAARTAVNSDAHVALVTALRTRGDRSNQLRRARIRFSQSFALPAKLWRQWIADEVRGKDLESDPEARASVCQLCEDALRDFVDVGVWMTYLEVVSGVAPVDESEESDDDEDDDDDGDDANEDQQANSRALFERAITTAGMHYSQGARLWRMYRSWEKSLHASSAVEKKERVASLYRRQLVLPLKGNESAIETFTRIPIGEARMSKEEVDNLVSVGAKLKLKCEPHEVAIAIAAAADASMAQGAGGGGGGGGSTLVEKWVAYASMLSKDCGQVPLALSVFERAAAMASGRVELWSAYLSFTRRDLKDADLTLKVATRAVRNCPSVLELHLTKLLAMERCGATPDEVEAAKEGALARMSANNSKGGDEHHHNTQVVLMAHLDYLRRALSTAWAVSPPEVQVIVGLVQRIRSAFAVAHASLATTKKALSSDDATVSANQRRLDLYRYECVVEEDLVSDISGGDASAARAVAEACVKALGATTGVLVGQQAWLDLASFERRQGGDPQLERNVFKRAWAALGGRPSSVGENICAAWLLFERERGTLDSYEEVCARLNIAHGGDLPKTAPSSFPSQPSLTTLCPPPEPRVSKVALVPVKGNVAAPLVSAPSVAKRVRSEDKELRDTSATKLQRTEKDSTPKPSSEEEEEDPVSSSSSLFVTNLPFDVTEEELGAVFTELGSVAVSVVLRLNRAKRFRGMATVQFSSPEEALSAQNAASSSSSSGLSLRGRQLQVSIASPPLKKKGKSDAADMSSSGLASSAASSSSSSTSSSSASSETTAATDVERKWPAHPTTVFVKGLEKGVNDETLAAMFAHCGSIATARVLLDKLRGGASRQEGLVQFEEAAPAVLLALQMSGGGHGITVEPSRFPAAVTKKVQKKNPYLAEASSKKPQASSSPHPAPPTARPDTKAAAGPAKFSFLPRALIRK
jgi:RNA recognition motif-containing protein